ncbi:MAG: hypothetical protein V1767_07695 [Chloroflexota bacterium]
MPIGSAGWLFTPQHRAQLQGQHSRRHQPEPHKLYVAGIDLAGEAEDSEGNILKAILPKKDSTVVTIGELFPIGTILKQMGIKIVEHYRWTGTKHADLYQTLVDLLKNVWACKRVVVDATGIGEPVASFLKQALGSRVLPFKFTQQSKSELGFELLAAINSGRLKIYRSDGSPEAQEFWFEVERARSQYRPSQTMNFYLDPSEGHDDFLMSLALLVEAANQYEPRAAKGSGT